MVRSRITSVSVRNFKSIATADVRLDDLTLLVGPNGAGKSNFLQAIRFVADAAHSLPIAVDRAHGFPSMLHQERARAGPRVRPTVNVGVEMSFEDGAIANYRIGLSRADQGEFVVASEKAFLAPKDGPPLEFSAERGIVKHRSDALAFLPSVSPDRTLLPLATSIPALRCLQDALIGISVYNNAIDPPAITQPTTDDIQILSEDGDNLANCLRALKQHDLQAFSRINEYLERVVPGMQVDVHDVSSPHVSLRFTLGHLGAANPLVFFPHQISDGTIQVLFVLTALFQHRKRWPSLVALEEPERAIHPGVVAILADAMIEASADRQVIVTTHSPDFLDHPDLRAEQMRVVDNTDGTTTIGDFDVASKQAIRDRLYTPGELLRLNQISSQSGTATQSEVAEVGT